MVNGHSRLFDPEHIGNGVNQADKARGTILGCHDSGKARRLLGQRMWIEGVRTDFDLLGVIRIEKI